MAQRIFLLFALIINTVTGMGNRLEKATLGGGCFWCTEAVYKELKGVKEVWPGYSGGHVKNPSYREVCNGNTGHAEVVQITYDPEIIPFSKILEVFFMTNKKQPPAGSLNVLRRKKCMITPLLLKQPLLKLSTRLRITIKIILSGIKTNPIVSL